MTLPSPLLLITDRTLARYPLAQVVAGAFAGGCRWVLVREKDLTPEQLVTLIEAIQPTAREYDASLSISDKADIAATCRIQGVHLSWRKEVALATAQTRRVMGPNVIVGVSTHSFSQAQMAADAGADYVTFSPIYLTESKPGYGPALGLDELRRVAVALPTSVFALGGITPQNASACLAAGAAGVAVMGAVMRAERPEHIVRELVDCLGVSNER